MIELKWQRHKKDEPVPEGNVVYKGGCLGIAVHQHATKTWCLDGWHFILPPAPADPRVMPVWEWRKFPEVEFVVSGHWRYKWQGYNLYSMDLPGSPPPMYADSQLLEAEGVEVVE